MTKKFMVIDGNSIMNRAFYGLQGANMLATSDGLYTNAIYGFLNILFKYREEEKPDYICIAFDLKAPTFRHKEFEGYKAHRKGMPDELRVQVPVLKEVIDAMNIMRLEIEGYEADDILGTISRHCEEQDMQTVIVTGDKDSFQLISPNTKVKIPITRKGQTETEEYTIQKFVEKYEIQPIQFIDVKGIMGDTSDNIPGVPGVGEVTALKLIKEYGNVEAVLENAEDLNVRKNVKESIIANKELAILSKRLATIERNVPIEIDLNKFISQNYDSDKLYTLFKRLEFNSLLQKMNLTCKETNDVKVTVLKEMSQINELVKQIIRNKKLTYLFNYDRRCQNKICGIGIYFNNESYYIELSEDNSYLKELFENESINKSGYDVKHDIVTLNSLGIKYNGIEFDVMIAAYLLNPSRDSYNFDKLVQEYLKMTIPSESEFIGKGQLTMFDYEEVAKFFGGRVEYLEKLIAIIKKEIIENNQEELFYNIELPLVEVLASMQLEGFKVDKNQLLELSKELEGKIEILIKDIYILAEEEFNINSPKQLGVILFDKLGLPVIKKTKTGYSTNAEVLEALSSQHEVVEKILEYRQLVKLKSTYADGLLNVINSETGRIHSNFNQTVTQTGRISSTEPNLQNIPVRLEMGRKFRKVFIASDDNHVLIDADYSQIELRVLAHIADDEHMIDAFLHNQDIHKKTASEVFDVSMDEVTSTMRNRAKAVNFGIVYGIGDFSLAKDLGITRKEAKKYIENYLENFTGVRNYMHEIVEIGKVKGYVTTLLNRRRYLPELKSSNFNMRSFGERIAMNTPIQGTAADIIKIAMVNVYRELKSRNLKSKLILQVHDELIIDTVKDETNQVQDILETQMTNAIQIKVPLTIDMNVGNSWYDTK